jgi:hypothetical protein
MRQLSSQKTLDIQRGWIISLLRLWCDLQTQAAVRPAPGDRSLAEANYLQCLRALDPELQRYFHSDGSLRHPLIFEPVVAARIPDINGAFREKKALVRQAEHEQNWRRLIFIHERFHRIRPLQKALRHINDPKEAACLVSEVWTDSENIRRHWSAWHSIWAGLADPWLAMNEQERFDFEKFPDRLTIFRGQSGRRGLTQGLSWTVDQTKAESFARRFSHRGAPFVASGRVFKRDVFAYFTDRHESEIVVSPNRIRDLTVTDLPDRAEEQQAHC